MNDYKRWTDKNWKQFDCSEMYKAFAELEDKIENGTLIELPFKVGDTFYDVYLLGIVEDTITGIEWDEEGIHFHSRKCMFTQDAVGMSVFPTKAQAKAKLQKIKEELKRQG